MKEEVEKALSILKKGDTILYPTDTIWGIGCDATNEAAVKKVYEIKGRSDSKALIVLISSIEQLWDYVEQVPEIAWDIVEFADQPLTIIYPKAKRLAANLSAEDGSIAIRLVQDDFCKRLINRLNRPIVSTSANISGEVSPQNFNDIDRKIKERVDHIVNWNQGAVSNNKPSKIIKLGLKGEVTIIRS